jgi:serine/threonine protein kinase
MKCSLIRSAGNPAKRLADSMSITNYFVKSCLVKKYELDSQRDITEFAIKDKNGIFERGVYKVRTFGQGEIVVKVFRKTRSEAIDYYENIKNTHLAWQQDSSLGQYILKVQLKSKRPDYDEAYGLLFMELEKARETLALKLKRKDQYMEEERIKDYKELVSAVTYLHQRGDEIGRNFHGDLKPDNIFFVEHRNADGHNVNCLKIGDIEDCLGTLAYRDSHNISLQAWENGTLPPTWKDDDLMAIKMIFLEMAYDFCLFDFCDEFGEDTGQWDLFLKKKAHERKMFIEEKKGKQIYLKNIPASKMMAVLTLETDTIDSIIKKQQEEQIAEMSKKYKPWVVCKIICKDMIDCCKNWENPINSIETLKDIMGHWLKSLEAYKCKHTMTHEQFNTELTSFYYIYRYLAEFFNLIDVKVRLEKEMEKCLEKLGSTVKNTFKLKDISQLSITQYPRYGAFTEKAFKNLNDTLEFVSSIKNETKPHPDEYIGMDSPWDIDWVYSLIHISSVPPGQPFIKKRIYCMRLKGDNNVYDLSQCLYILEKHGCKSNLNTQKELDNLIKFQHPNVLELKSIFMKMDVSTVFSTERMDGNLDFTNQMTQLEELINKLSPWDLVQHLLNDIFSAILWIHNKKYVHSDLSGRNILFKNLEGDECIFKICDFGNTEDFDEVKGKKDLQDFWGVINSIFAEIRSRGGKTPVMTLILDALSSYFYEYKELEYEKLKSHICDAIAVAKTYLPENFMAVYYRNHLDFFEDSHANEIKIILPTRDELKFLFLNYNDYVSIEDIQDSLPKGNETTLFTLKKYVQQISVLSKDLKFFFGINKRWTG